MSWGFTERQVAVQFDDTPPGQARVNARNGDNMMRPFDSTIGDLANGSRPFTLIVRAHVVPHPPGNHVFPDVNAQGQPVQQTVTVSAADVPRFKQRARADIEAVWNRNGRGRLWLVTVDITRGYQGLGDQRVPPPLKCLVDLQWTDDPRDAHLRISLLATGTNALPRSNCALGGRPLWSDVDMVMHDFQAGDGDWHNWQANRFPIQSGASAPMADPTPYQSVFAHEFGHFLNLPHPFTGAVSGNGALGEYGIGMNNPTLFYYVMGVGNDMIPRVTQPWQTQLVHHNYFPSRTFLPTVQIAEAQSVRANDGWSLRQPPVTHTVGRELQMRLGRGDTPPPNRSGWGDHPTPDGNPNTGSA